MLVVDELSVSYRGAVAALHTVNLTVPDGAVVAVLGANGAGKSTLLRAISGVLDRHHGSVIGGSIRFGDRELVGLESADIVRGGVVQVPEGRRIFADLTVEENLQLGAHTVPAAKRGDRLDRVYDLFPVLHDRRTGRAGLLSGGEQQMLAMGRALMADPRLLLLDEPSLGLAPQLVQQVGEIIRTINEAGTSVLLIEQNATMGLDVADHAVLLEVGRVHLAGPAAELAATDDVRDRYLGVGTGSVVVDDTAASSESEPEAPTDRRDPKPLAIENLSVRFGGVQALSDVSMTLEPGRIHALIGPNGAGKSTCINVLSSVIAPTDGRVLHGGVDITSTPPSRIAGLGIARTFQNLSLSPEATVLDSILVGRHCLMRAGLLASALRLPSARLEEESNRESARKVAAEVGLSDRLHARIRSLSYGDRKRVELARALCSEPDILLLDEPVAGMTHGESQDMAEAIRTTHRLHGLTILIVEHDMAFVMGLAEQITVLDFGRRIASGTPGEVQSDPSVQAAYLGRPAA